MENQQEGDILGKLVHAFEVYLVRPNDNSLRELVGKAVAIAGFGSGEATLRLKELLWECALASEKGRLRMWVFICYVFSVIDHGFIPIRLRPTM